MLTNSATASGKDFLLQPEDDTSNNTDTATTTVHTPVLTLAKSATATVNAGEAITYTLTYENTGSGAAKNVVLTDTLAGRRLLQQGVRSGHRPPAGHDHA